MTIHLLYFHANRGQENSMERWWFNSILFKKELARRCGLNKSMDSLGPIENTSEIEDSNRKDTTKNIQSWGGHDDSSYSNVVGVKDIRNFIPDKTFLVKDSNGDSYSIYLDIENQIFEIDNNHSFLSELKSSFDSYRNSSYLPNGSTSEDTYYNHYMNDTQYSWNNHITSCIDSYLQSKICNNHITSCIDSYLRSKICIDTSAGSDSDNYSESYIYRSICGKNKGELGDSDRAQLTIRESSNDIDVESSNDIDVESSNDIDVESSNDIDVESSNDIDVESSNDIDVESSNDIDVTQKYRHLWVQCENCYGLNYKRLLKSKMYICEECGSYLKMSCSDRIELSIDPGTWHPMYEHMVSLDPIEFHSEEEPYHDRLDSYQRETGFTEAVQTGTGKLNGIPVAVGVMDFQFMGGSMGSVVGEKITRLIEYATNQLLPLIIVCASGGARMQEGSLSLMQMAKISSALYNYQSKKKLFYVSILTSPTTGGVTASFGMLGDIIIAEPEAYIAFAGKRVIEETLKTTVPEGSQAAEYLFQKGLLDLIVPRNLLKSVLNELFQLHPLSPLNPN
uniref:acetyl-CoA carboxylase carboxyltransferase beta subunit n=1 Tax=Alyxia sinensis TaxID=582711 RepID=UPI002551D8F1|nr:acetyl-CoA carboxylase carboxyltransferase beta subunit [Alyxia sinensis]WEV93505.1 acetyl-CoA carboxylase carboxyltransferase beta subunit [Alyxia sinensis]